MSKPLSRSRLTRTAGCSFLKGFAIQGLISFLDNEVRVRIVTGNDSSCARRKERLAFSRQAIDEETLLRRTKERQDKMLNVLLKDGLGPGS